MIWCSRINLHSIYNNFKVPDASGEFSAQAVLRTQNIVEWRAFIVQDTINIAAVDDLPADLERPEPEASGRALRGPIAGQRPFRICGTQGGKTGYGADGRADRSSGPPAPRTGSNRSATGSRSRACRPTGPLRTLWPSAAGRGWRPLRPRRWRSRTAPRRTARPYTSRCPVWSGWR